MFESSMKQKGLVIAATLALGACATGGNEPNGYVTSAYNQVWRSGASNTCIKAASPSHLADA